MTHSHSRIMAVAASSGGRLGLCVAGAVLMAAAFAPVNWHWTMWFGLLPLLFALRDLRPGDAAAWAGLFGICFFALTVHWLWNLFGAFSGALFVISALCTSVFGWAYAIARARFSPATLILLTPTLWVATEYFRAEVWALRFGWGALGYSQVENTAVLQAASVIGVYGVTWLVVFANALLYWTLTRPGDRGVRIMWMVGSLFATGVKLNDGASRRREQDRVAEKILGACVQGEEVAADEYERAAEALGPVDLMVLPEYALYGDPSSDVDAPVFARIARQHGAHLIYGAKRYTDDTSTRFRNIALTLDERGEPTGEYAKRRPVQFFNDGIPGREANPTKSRIGSVGIAICYDGDFEAPCRETVAAGAQVLAVPTFDARFWGRTMHLQHEAMPRMRAAECGRYLLRSASSGYSMIIGPRGEVLARARTQEPEAISAEVGLRDTLTAYVRYGWLLPRVCLAVMVLLMAGEAIRSRRRR